MLIYSDIIGWLVLFAGTILVAMKNMELYGIRQNREGLFVEIATAAMFWNGDKILSLKKEIEK